MFITLGFVFGILSFGVPKFAVVFLLIQILSPRYWHQVFLWVMASACTLFLTVCIILTYAQCNPPRALWTFNIPDAKCIDPGATVPVAVFAGGEWPLSLISIHGAEIWMLIMPKPFPPS